MLPSAQLGICLEKGLVEKRYIARVVGEFPSLLTAREPIRMRTAHGRTVCDCHATGKESLTHFRALGFDTASATTLVLCLPRTGRSHQIRLHLQHVGHPIANDPLYGSASGEVMAEAAATPNVTGATTVAHVAADPDVLWWADATQANASSVLAPRRACEAGRPAADHRCAANAGCTHGAIDCATLSMGFQQQLRFRPGQHLSCLWTTAPHLRLQARYWSTGTSVW